MTVVFKKNRKKITGKKRLLPILKKKESFLKLLVIRIIPLFIEYNKLIFLLPLGRPFYFM